MTKFYKNIFTNISVFAIRTLNILNAIYITLNAKLKALKLVQTSFLIIFIKKLGKNSFEFDKIWQAVAKVCFYNFLGVSLGFSLKFKFKNYEFEYIISN